MIAMVWKANLGEETFVTPLILDSYSKVPSWEGVYYWDRDTLRAWKQGISKVQGVWVKDEYERRLWRRKGSDVVLLRRLNSRQLKKWTVQREEVLSL
jgi:hypothetical protein